MTDRISVFPLPTNDYHTRRFIVYIEEEALLNVELDDTVRGALWECETSRSHADKVMALYFLAKRIERQYGFEAPAGPILPQIILLPKESTNVTSLEKRKEATDPPADGGGTTGEPEASGL